MWALVRQGMNSYCPGCSSESPDRFPHRVKHKQYIDLSRCTSSTHKPQLITLRNNLLTQVASEWALELWEVLRLRYARLACHDSPVCISHRQSSVRIISTENTKVARTCLSFNPQGLFQSMSISSPDGLQIVYLSYFLLLCGVLEVL